MSEQAGRYQRSATGMVGAMLVLLALVVGFVLVRDLLRETPERGVRTVDYLPVAEVAQESAEFDLLVPTSLPVGWRATSVDFVPMERSRWHLGLLTDLDRYVGLEQSTGSAESLVETYVDPEAVRGEQVTVDGQRWTTWTDAGGDTALVRSTGESTVLVVGTVGVEVLADFISRLE